MSILLTLLVEFSRKKTTSKAMLDHLVYLMPIKSTTKSKTHIIYKSQTKSIKTTPEFMSNNIILGCGVFNQM